MENDNKYVRIYLKDEEGGEFLFGTLSETQLKKYGILGDNDDDVDLDMLANDFHKLGNQIHIFGCSFYTCSDLKSGCFLDFNIGPQKINIIIGYQVFSAIKDNWYGIQITTPSKYSQGVTLPVLQRDFDPKLLTLKFISLNFPFSDSGGPIEDKGALVDLIYDGVSYAKELRESMTDRGFNYEVVVFNSKKEKVWERDLVPPGEFLNPNQWFRHGDNVEPIFHPAITIPNHH